MRRWLFFLLASSAMVFAQKRPFDVNAMMELKRIGDPQISLDVNARRNTARKLPRAAGRFPSSLVRLALIAIHYRSDPFLSGS